MNFLAAADKANNHGPIHVAVHVLDQELGLGVREVVDALALLHEVRGLGTVPGALGLVKDHDMVCGWPRVAQRLVAEVVDVLDESLHGLAGVGLGGSLAAGLAPFDIVAGQRLAQHGDERTIAGEEDGVRWGLGVASLGREVQPHQGLAGPGYTGDEADELAFVRAGFFDQRVEAQGGEPQVGGLGIVAGDGVDGMLGVQGAGGLDDGWSGAVGSGGPGGGIVLSRGRVMDRGLQGLQLREQGGHRVNRDCDGAGYAVRGELTQSGQVGCRVLDANVVPALPGGDQDRDNPARVTRSVEVLEIEGVVPGLVKCGAFDATLSNLELDHHDQLAEQQHCVDAPAHAGDRELKKDAAFAVVGEPGLQQCDLGEPGLRLCGLDGMVATGAGEGAEDGVGGCSEEGGNKVVVPGARQAVREGGRHCTRIADRQSMAGTHQSGIRLAGSHPVRWQFRTLDLNVSTLLQSRAEVHHDHDHTVEPRVQPGHQQGQEGRQGRSGVHH